MKKWLIVLSVTLNAIVALVVIGAFTFGSQLLTKYYLPLSHERWVTQFDMLPVAAEDIVFLGDSITEGGVWEELFPDLSVRNRGIGGDVTAGVLKRLDKIAAGKPAKVFLLIGTNDLNGGIAIEEIAANINTIIDTIATASPTTRIYVQSVLPRAAKFRTQVETLNDVIKNGLNGRAQWIDLYPLFLDQADGSIRNDLSNDELHLMGEGYLIWRDAIASLVRD